MSRLAQVDIAILQFKFGVGLGPSKEQLATSILIDSTNGAQSARHWAEHD